MNIRTFTVNPLGVNCYVVSDPGTLASAIIDPGMFFCKESESVSAYISEHQLRVTHILLTHAHFDHAMSAQWAGDTFGVAVTLHAADEPLLLNLSEQIRKFLRRNIPVCPPTNIRRASNGDTIALGGLELKVLHTPGHTPGGLCYLCGDTLFSGDSLFQGSIGRTDLAGGDPLTLIDSVRSLMSLPDATRVMPGHGPSTTIGYERQYNPYI